MMEFVAGLPRLFHELKRRHVFRVALVYAGVGWLTVQVSSALFPALRLPAWSLSLVTAMVLVGFPLALVLAWAYDLTPTGVQRTRSADHGEPSAKPYDGEDPSGNAAADQPKPVVGSLAVLPFLDLGPAAEHQFLGDGIADELIGALARLEGIRIVSRTSTFALRGLDLDVRQIGARLGVAHTVEGTVRVTGDRLRVTVQLVEVQSGFAVWTESFNRQITDLLEVQEDLAHLVVNVLRDRLGAGVAAVPASGSGEPLVRTSTADVSAYTYYLRGRARWNERTPQALTRAIQHFERAIALDPGYAHAYAGLADAYAILLDYGLADPREAMPNARRAAELALQLGADLAEAHTSAALVRQLEWRWAEAETGFRKAITLDPGYAPARHRLALLLAWQGRFAESRSEIEAAASSDPLSPVVSVTRGWIEYYAGEYPAAIAHAEETRAEHAGFEPARIPLALSLLQVGRTADAVAELEQVATGVGRTSASVALLIHALGHGGSAEEASGRMRELRRQLAQGYVSPYYMAIARLGIGDREGALQDLERGVAQRAAQVAYMAVDPLLDPLRGGGRFERLLETTGLTNVSKGAHRIGQAAV